MAAPKLYVGVGHGMTPAGVFDPGAVHPPYTEHALNFNVAQAYAAAARRCGIDVVVDKNAGVGHDPNWVGSAAAANAWGADRADEIHHNAGGGSGAEVLIHPASSASNRASAARAARAIARSLGLPDRGVVPRGDLGFLRATRMPASIVEACFLDAAADRAALGRPDYAEQVGEALAAAAAAYLGLPYVPPGGPAGGTLTVAGLRAELSRFYDTLVDGDATHPVTLRGMVERLVRIEAAIARLPQAAPAADAAAAEIPAAEIPAAEIPAAEQLAIVPVPLTTTGLRAELSRFYDTLVDGDATHPVTLRGMVERLARIQAALRSRWPAP